MTNRYCDPKHGCYTQVDPIVLSGGNPTLYGYVTDPNSLVDLFGLRCPPVSNKTTASNGLNYQSNPKYTPGNTGYRNNAGIEPRNSLDLFEDSVPSTSKPNQRYTHEKPTDTLHRFFNDGNDTWHWSGSTNQGANSLTGRQVLNDIKNAFNLPKKGW